MDVDEVAAAEEMARIQGARVRRRRRPPSEEVAFADEDLPLPADLPPVPHEEDEAEEEDGQGTDLPLVDLEEPPAEPAVVSPPRPIQDHPFNAAVREMLSQLLVPVTNVQSGILRMRESEIAADQAPIDLAYWQHLQAAQRAGADLYRELGICLAIARPR